MAPRSDVGNQAEGARVLLVHIQVLKVYRTIHIVFKVLNNCVLDSSVENFMIV